MNIKRISKIGLIALIILQLVQVPIAQAAILTVPPLIRVSVAPNVFYTLDDSGSMMFEMIPENIGRTGDPALDVMPGRTTPSGTLYDNYCADIGTTCWVSVMFPRPPGVYAPVSRGDYSTALRTVVGFNHNLTVARWRTSDINKMYYNPKIYYKPWSNADGTPMPNATITAAKYNPIMPKGGSVTPTLDLTQNQTVPANSIHTWLSDNARATHRNETTYYPALYYVLDKTVGAACDKADSKLVSDLTCFTRIEIRPGSTYTKRDVAREDCTGTSCTYEQEIQNFANWFQYYRSRILMARAASGRAFSSQSNGIRVGFGTINTTGTVVSKISNDFGATAKEAFLKSLYESVIPQLGTPLRKAIDEVGQYFKDSSSVGPWQNKYGDAASGQFTCRQNYNILMTDGYWTDGNEYAPASSRRGNYDGSNGTQINGLTSNGAAISYQYTNSRPYTDSFSNTLADIAFYYWVNDLRTDWGADKKNVPTSASDPAFWQHLVQFTVGLGTRGNLNPDTDLPKLTDGTLSWPNPILAEVYKTDDLWHAAVNTRGQYFSASDPNQFVNALNSALSTINARTGNAAALGSSGGFLYQGAGLYSSSYNTTDWSGEISKFVLNQDGTVNSTAWTSSLPDSARVMYTYKDHTTKGQLFTYANLLPDQKTVFDTFASSYSLLGSDIVEYFKTATYTGKLRKRDKPFGDFVGSSPQYLKEGEDAGYVHLPIGVAGKTTYQQYLIDKAQRKPMVYVGGNDGMFHAFNDSDGTEAFAYIPKTVMKRLPNLANPNYVHEFFVDGTPEIGDVYLGGWKTVLAGSFAAGGRGIYVLNLPLNGVFERSDIMWEINSDDNSEIGYTIGTPQIGRHPDGSWVVVFGNGYESASKKAALFVLNLSTGVLTKIDTGVGSSTSPNGLGTPRLLFDQTATIQAAYAGDLQGNLWKFDFNSSGTRVAFNGTPLFKASNSNIAQPITTKPDIIANPRGGFMVVFGTGKIFEDTDATTTDIQSMYGIWDKVGIAGVTPSAITDGVTSLQQQTLTQRVVGTNTFYDLSNNAIDWRSKRGWYTNFALDGTKKTGERVIVDPQIVNGIAVFTSLIPNASTDPCSGTDGYSGIYLFDAVSGSPLGYNVFDTNTSGNVDSTDSGVSGQRRSATFGSTVLRSGNTIQLFHPKSVNSGGSSADKGTSGTSPPQPSQRFWRQILGKD